MASTNHKEADNSINHVADMLDAFFGDSILLNTDVGGANTVATLRTAVGRPQLASGDANRKGHASTITRSLEAQRNIDYINASGVAVLTTARVQAAATVNALATTLRGERRL